MTCMIKQLKRLAWVMVVATIVVLTWLSNDPNTRANMIVAGSSRVARGKRQLRSIHVTTEKVNEDDEDRGGITLDLFPAHTDTTTLPAAVNPVKDLETGTTLALFPMSTDAKALPAAVNTVKDLETGTTKIGEAKGMLESVKQVWVKLKGQAESFKLVEETEYFSKYNKDEVLSLLAKEKVAGRQPSLPADLLAKGLVVKGTLDGRMDDVVALLAAGMKDATEFLGSPFFKDWIILYKEVMGKEPYSLMYEELLLKRRDFVELAEQLAVAKENGDAKRVTTRLVEQMMEKWSNEKVPKEVVFQDLGLRKGGINKAAWGTWVSYLVDNEDVISEEGVVKLELRALKKVLYLNVNELLGEATTVKGQERAKALEELLESKKLALMKSQKRRGENDGETPPMPKRQRNDDGQ